LNPNAEGSRRPFVTRGRLALALTIAALTGVALLIGLGRTSVTNAAAASASQYQYQFQCFNGGWQALGFPSQAACVKHFRVPG
jgi:galactitol-specific phosphotransferase system IIC component